VHACVEIDGEVDRAPDTCMHACTLLTTRIQGQQPASSSHQIQTKDFLPLVSMHMKCFSLVGHPHAFVLKKHN
jgi:hypothetical protein